MSDMLRMMGTAMQPDAATRAGVPGGIVEFPEQVPPVGSKPFDEGMRSPWDVGGWHPPMALPSSTPTEQPPGSSDQGGFFGTIGKVASNPLLLAALKGYAGALGMPRGAGPITRIAGGLSSGLEDYFVEAPYRQTMTEKAKAQTEKEKVETEEATTKSKVLKGLPPSEQATALYPGLASSQAKKDAVALKEKQAQALIPYYQSQAAQLQGKNQAMAEVYSQAAESLGSGADPKEVAGFVRLAQQGQHTQAMEGLSQQRLQQIGAHQKVMEQQGQERLGQGRERLGQEKAGAIEKVETFDPETGVNTQKWEKKSDLLGQTMAPKKDVSTLRAINTLKTAQGMMDLLEQDVAAAPDKRGWLKAKWDKYAYDFGMKPPNDRSEMITQTGAVIQQLQQMATASGNTRAYSALKQYQAHFPQYGDSDEQILSKLKTFRKNMSIVADSLGYEGFSHQGKKAEGKPEENKKSVTVDHSQKTDKEILKELEK